MAEIVAVPGLDAQCLVVAPTPGTAHSAPVTWSTALALGAVVGLGVAMPLGAIGVLLVHTGMAQGWRPAAAGGLGVATVDVLYAVLAVLAGSAVSGALDGHERAVRWVGAVVLAAVALRGVVGMRRAGAAPDTSVWGPDADAAPTPDATVAPTPETPAPRGPVASYLRFLGLTAVNPLTIVYFTAVVAGLGDRVAATAARVAFVVGIGVASSAWQVALAGVGAVLGARVSHRVAAVLTGAGYAVVGGFAVALVLS